MTSALPWLLMLLAAPAGALVRIADRNDWPWLAGGALAVSAATFLAVRADKQRARRGAPRIPEAVLHLAELCGGWPGGFLAQRVWRHKTAKPGYQAVFWTIVLLHEAAACEVLAGGRLTRAAADFLRTLGS